MSVRHPLLSVAGITVTFSGVTAQRDVSLDVPGSGITAVLGPNGAGKTTLFNVVSGAQRPDSGHVWYDGADLVGRPPGQIAGAGIARTFQNIRLAGNASVVDNVMLGASRFRRYGMASAALRLRRVSRDDAELEQLAMRAITFLGLSGQEQRLVRELPYGDQRRVEIARALAMGPRLLLLDEPSAGMDRVETADLATAIRRIDEELGVAVVLIEHDLELVRAVAHQATVLDFGEVIASGVLAEVLADERVVRAYLGRGAAVPC